MMRRAIVRRARHSASLRALALRLRRLPGLRPALEWYQERTADALLISFPKCGRTWLRLMLGRALACHFQLDYPGLEGDMLELSPLAARHAHLPRVHLAHDDDPEWKTPAELAPDKSRYSHARVILLVRDPRDVVVSLYFEQKKRLVLYQESLHEWVERLRPYRQRMRPYAGELADFVYEEVGSFATLLRFYDIWAQARHRVREFMLVRYEDLHADAPHELRRILDFLGLPGVSDGVLADAARYAAFERMHEMERHQTLGSFRLRPADPLDEESYKTRRGRVGGFVDYLAPAEIATMSRRMEEELDQSYGYLV